MFSKRELQLVCAAAAVLLLIGVVGYAALPEKSPPEPVRIVYPVTAGNVLFDHKTHADETGYGLSCGDCHHTLAEDEYADAQSCTECHDPVEGDEEVPKRADAFHRQCAGCHEDYEAGPAQKQCALCHVR